MSETTQTPAIGRIADPVDELDGPLAVSASDLGDRLWHFFISMRTGLALILALAGLALIGTLLVQAPSGLASQPDAYAAWLESVRPKYGGWTSILSTLGLFDIFNSVWFRGITVLLMTSVLACSANRAPHLWKLTVHPRTRMSESFFDHAPLTLRASGPVTPEVATAAIETALHARRFRTIVETDGDVINVYADHNRWGPFGTVIAHLSLVVILLGALVGATFGFHDDSMAVTVGSTVDVGHGTGLAVLAKSFSDSYYADGSPSDYASGLVVSRDGTAVAEQTIRVNDPLQVGDVTFYQSYFGPAAVMHIAGTDGTVIFDGGVPLQFGTDSGTRVVGRIDVPASGFTALVIAPASGEVDPTIAAGQMLVEIYQTGDQSTPVATEVLTQGQATAMGGMDVTFVRERQFTGLIAAKDPGMPFIWLGAAFLIAGTALVFFFPSRRVWARVRRDSDGSDLRLAAVVRHDVGFEAEFVRLSDELRTGLGASTGQ